MRVSSVALCLAVCLCLGAGAAAEEPWPVKECRPEFGVALKNRAERDGIVHLQYQVEIAAEESCVEVRYDLVVHHLLPNGQWKSFRLGNEIDVTGGAASQLVEHTMSPDLKLHGQRVLLVACRLCDTDVAANDLPSATAK
jgi:hypothetical protein